MDEFLKDIDKRCLGLETFFLGCLIINNFCDILIHKTSEIVFFCYIYIYIYIYMCVYIYIYIYI